MKPVKKLWLSGDAVHPVDVNLVLELNACGRGFISAETDTDYTGKLVRLDVGYSDLLLRWFTGYVERAQPADNGTQRLFVRELTGVFERGWPCSFQHPTLKQITDWLTENSRLAVTTADADYASKPIPHFTHSGSGYQLLANLGTAFNVPDYVWYQLPDGDVWLGSAEHAIFAGKPVEIPAQFASAAAGGNSMSIPVVQSVRPGVEVNGQRITRVCLRNDEIDLTWTPRDKKTGKPLQKTAAQRQVERAFPELASGLHLPKFARVIAPTENVVSGNIADPFRPRYAVDVQLLDADGNPDGSTPVYPAVPLPVPMAGNDSGMFQFPPAGTMVEIGFTDGRPDKPFIRQTMPQGNSLPDIKPGEQLQQQRAEVLQRVTQNGDWIRQTDQTINESSMSRIITADDETRTLITRETTIKATDKTTVIGTATLLAGAVQHVCLGDYATAVKGNRVTTVTGDLTEKIDGIRKSAAAIQQQLTAPVVWLGSEQINVLQLMLDTLDVIQQLAAQTAGHTHPSTAAPTNAAAINQTGSSASALARKYNPLIG